MRNRRYKLLPVLAAGTALLVAAPTVSATTPPAGSAAGGGELPAPSSGWKVNTDDCVDPAKATTPITGELKVGSIMPLSGTTAAIAFAPVVDGLKAYFQYANEQKMLGDVNLSLTVEDDQYNKDLTPAAATKLIDAGVQVFTGVIGSADNEAIRDTLNSECIPQLLALTGSPAWGEVAEYPWTTGGLLPYTVETKIYAAHIASTFPNGAKVALYAVNSEFGQIFSDGFKKAIEGTNIELVDEQSVADGDSNPPTSQVTAIASKKPDVIVAVPLGTGCGAFLNELDAAEAANPGWAPPVYVTNTCASPLILALAGAGADGILTATNLVQVGDPKNADNPAVKQFVDYMTAQGKGDTIDTSSTGWTVGEITVAILQAAQKSPDGLTRASIINATRSLMYKASLARDGIVFRLDGEADVFGPESAQMLQYHVDTKTFTELGPVDSSNETR